MAIYKIIGDKESLAKVAPTSFDHAGLLERSDLQRILRDQPEVLEEGLLIVSEEFCNWQDSNRRIDLLGLDSDGRLVVIELKRGDTGEHMDLQAIRYAAMVANMTFQQTVDTYQAYLEKRANESGSDPVEEGDAESRIREKLGIGERDNQAIHTEIPRIMLVSENFGRELTTCVMWLNDSWLRGAGHEIKCIRLEPHRNGNEILIETNVVVPLPEAADYQTQLGQRDRETRSESSGRAQQVPGGGSFYASIAKAQERFHPDLRQLYDFAINLEGSGLSDLSTYTNRKGDYTRLELRVPRKDIFLASFNNLLFQGGAGEISFWPGWEGSAPNSPVRIGEIIGPVTSKSGVRHRRLSGKKYDWEAIMATIGGAYREASGVTTE